MPWTESHIDERRKQDDAMLRDAYVDVIQSANSTVGVTSLDYDGGSAFLVSLKICIEHLGVSVQGIRDITLKSPLEMIDYYTSSAGVMFRKIKLEGEWWKDSAGPILAMMEDGQSVALIPNKYKGYSYYDHLSRSYIRINSGNAKRVTGLSYLFYKPLPDDCKNQLAFIRFAVSSVRRINLIRYVLYVAAFVLIAAMLPIAYWIVFNRVVPAYKFDLIAPIGFFLLAVVVSMGCARAVRTMISHALTIHMQAIVESALFARVLKLPIDFHRKNSSEDIAKKISAARNYVGALNSFALSVFFVFLSIVANIAVLGIVVPFFIPAAFLFVLLEIIVIAVVVFFAMKYEQRAAKATSDVSKLSFSLFNGMPKIIASGAQKRAFAKWAHMHARSIRVRFNQPFLYVTHTSIAMLIVTMTIAFLNFNANSYSIDDGMFMASYVIFAHIFSSLMMLISFVPEAAKLSSLFSLFEPILKSSMEKISGGDYIAKLDGNIEVSNASFSYGPDFPSIVDNISFKIHSGEYVALVGESGSGKTTVLKLLLGLERAERGSIYYGKYDLYKANLSSLRKNIGVVMQESRLLEGDIFTNITLSSSDATMDDAWRAAEIAGVADVIRAMPMGMHTIINSNSSNISGGQMQRILIARAVCMNKKILIFDEATSALDNQTQKEVINALNEMNSTRIVVAHRLSTVKDCDRILVLKNGTIYEEGSYEALMNLRGEFYSLVERQRL